MNQFNWKQYLSNYPDLQSAGINNHYGAWKHWSNFGLSEGRTDATFKVCIIYCYNERTNEQKNQTNLSFFIKYGLDKLRWKNINI